MGSHRVGHDLSDLAAAAAKYLQKIHKLLITIKKRATFIVEKLDPLHSSQMFRVNITNKTVQPHVPSEVIH